MTWVFESGSGKFYDPQDMPVAIVVKILRV
jgi:hypothetical protein